MISNTLNILSLADDKLACAFEALKYWARLVGYNLSPNNKDKKSDRKNMHYLKIYRCQTSHHTSYIPSLHME
jgi:hypothetical protein